MPEDRTRVRRRFEISGLVQGVGRECSYRPCVVKNLHPQTEEGPICEAKRPEVQNSLAHIGFSGASRMRLGGLPDMLSVTRTVWGYSGSLV